MIVVTVSGAWARHNIYIYISLYYSVLQYILAIFLKVGEAFGDA